MISALVLFVMTFVGIAWNSFDVYLLSYRLVKLGPSQYIETNRVQVMLGGMFVIWSYQWGVVYEHSIGASPYFLMMRAILLIASIVQMIGIVTYFLLLRKFKIENKS